MKNSIKNLNKNLFLTLFFLVVSVLIIIFVIIFFTEKHYKNAEALATVIAASVGLMGVILGAAYANNRQRSDYKNKYYENIIKERLKTYELLENYLTDVFNILTDYDLGVSGLFNKENYYLSQDPEKVESQIFRNIRWLTINHREEYLKLKTKLRELNSILSLKDSQKHADAIVNLKKNIQILVKSLKENIYSEYYKMYHIDEFMKENILEASE